MMRVCLGGEINRLRFKSFSVVFAQLCNLGCDYDLAVWLSSVVLEIFLVIVFSLVERLERNNLSYNWLLPDFRRVGFFDDLFRDCLLFCIVVEDDRSVLGPDISSLSI